jgi:hypothetical protein
VKFPTGGDFRGFFKKPETARERLIRYQGQADLV